jgi:hypothetical protein
MFRFLSNLHWGSISWSVFTVFLYWFAVTATYFIAKSLTDFYCKKHTEGIGLFQKIYVYSLCVVVPLIFSALLADRLGTHREGGDDYDDPGEIVVDYTPTATQQWTYGTKRFLVMMPVAILGAAAAIKRDKKLNPDERSKIKLQQDMDARKNDDGW